MYPKQRGDERLSSIADRGILLPVNRLRIAMLRLTCHRNFCGNTGPTRQQVSSP